MTSLQLEIDKARSALRIDEVHAQGNAAEQAAWAQALQDAISAQGKPSGVPWVDALSSSVRPVLTYWHCLVLYTSQKVAVALIASEAGATWASIVSQSYTTFDQQLVGSMVGFWFVDRSLRKS